ncbi:GNAT family N-acetyltransferase [Nucisporomicrobium flavum]|uniref:GNAT family N-acetyltransferase n=1 Tax=Nucisporomicrobium flavum TaxID=2785915 RepID=UPI003C308DD6
MDSTATERLTLRRVLPSDLDEFVALETALRATEQPPRPASDPAASARYLAAFCRVWDEGELGYWALELEGRVAGFGGVQPKLWRGVRCWNLYYRLYPVHWGQGLATEMAVAAIAAAADVHPDWPVLVETDPGNLAAIRVAERAGLRREPERPGDEYAVLLLTAAERTR